MHGMVGLLVGPAHLVTDLLPRLVTQPKYDISAGIRKHSSASHFLIDNRLRNPPHRRQVPMGARRSIGYRRGLGPRVRRFMEGCSLGDNRDQRLPRTGKSSKLTHRLTKADVLEVLHQVDGAAATGPTSAHPVQGTRPIVVVKPLIRHGNAARAQAPIVSRVLRVSRRPEALQNRLERQGSNVRDLILVHGACHLTPRRLVRSTVSVYAFLQFYTVW